ncbi:DUF4142 domain-containing protein [Sorangium sp. So ce1504]|uniref:DUF4142 domain-containing protein n=1 Tax=Sorangium sp. So ce1504 TaxID=3133337 RepID=UPI003F5E8FA1
MMRHHFKHRVAVIAALAASVIGSSAHAGGRGGYVPQGAQISQLQQRLEEVSPRSEETQVSDGALAKVISAVNEVEISLAMIARKQARSREVKDFAREMLEAHTQGEIRLSALLRRLRIKAEPTRASAMIAGHSSIIAAYLQKQPAEKFDQTYMAIQVRMHAHAVRMLDEQAIPRVKNQALKQEIQRIRDEAASHLKRAQAIQATLAKGQER